MHMGYPFLSLVPVVWVPGPNQLEILHLGVPTNLLIPHITLWVVPKVSKMHMAYTFWSLVPVVWVRIAPAMLNNREHS